MRCRLLGWLYLLAAPNAARAETPSFLNEVVPLFTKSGCSQGSCHGKGNGQNGFRLSLRGYAPDLDHRWLTREYDGRRIAAAEPGASLLLRKAIADVPHEGGRIFGRDSREYRTLFDWLKAGAPGPDKADAKLVRLELTPNDRTLKAGERVSLSAFGTFSDGSRRDVTWLTKFDTNDAAIADVTPAGVATANRNGATSIRAAFQTEVAVATLAVPFDRPVDAAKFTARTNFVDDHVFAKLAELRIEPSDSTGDAAFMRRLFLDACGVLPKPDELAAFLADASPGKRAKLIDHVLARPEFNDYWALLLGDLFQNRKERDHDVRGLKGVRQFHAWIRQQVAANRPWDELARDVLTATGKSTEQPAVGYYVVTVGENRHGENSEAAESVAQAFLGTRIGCAKCHNHPLERYTQDDFYHFAAFFSRVKLDRKDSKVGPTVLRISHPDETQNARPVGVSQPRTGQFLKAQPLDRTATDVAPKADPRRALAAWITNPSNAAFRQAMVNRLWKHYLGVGLVEPVDDLRATNPPSVPKLLDALSAEFLRAKFDLRQLMRVILNSRTYQLSSTTTANNQADARFYSHYTARRLPAEVLLDALTDASDVDEEFEFYPPGTRALQMADPGAASYFLRQFGRSDRVTACACERSGEVTLPQVLHLQNSTGTFRKVTDARGWLTARLATQPDDMTLMDELYARTLMRLPRAEERQAFREHLAGGDGRPHAFFDLFWAVLNAKEFAFNH